MEGGKALVRAEIVFNRSGLGTSPRTAAIKPDVDLQLDALSLESPTWNTKGSTKSETVG